MIARAAAAAAWLVLAVEAPLQAQGELPAGAAPPAALGRADLVEITVVGPAADYQRLIAPIGARTPSGVPLLWNRVDRFNPLAELLRVESPPSASVALRCWIDLSDLRRVTLYFASRGGERFLVRELALSGRLDEVDQQSLGQVVEISIAALLESQDNGLTRAEAREILARAQPAGEPTGSAAALARRWRLGAAVSYGIAAVAASLPMGQGPGATLSLLRARSATAIGPAAAFAPRAGFWVAGHYRLPASGLAPDIGLRLEALGARAGVVGGWGRVTARVGGGIDWVHVTPLAGRDGAVTTALTAPHWSAAWVLGGAVAARLPVDRAAAALASLALSLVLSVETLPVPTEYAVQDGRGARVPFALRRIRPGLALELGF